MPERTLFDLVNHGEKTLIDGAADEKKSEQPNWEKIEELFSTFEDWNHQLKNSEFESWTMEQAAFDHEEPQP